MLEIKESDWKFLRQFHKVALDRFCERILKEVDRAQSDKSKGFHERYLEIYRLIQERDKDIARTFNDLRRSTAVRHLAFMKLHGLVTKDDFQCFSPETRARVESVLAE